MALLLFTARPDMERRTHDQIATGLLWPVALSGPRLIICEVGGRPCLRNLFLGEISRSLIREPGGARAARHARIVPLPRRFAVAAAHIAERSS